MESSTGNMNAKVDETPKNDVIFKILFANPKHPNLLISLLNAVLKPETPIVKVDIKQTELTPEYLMQRGVRLDILATEKNGNVINVEMQKKDEYNMRERATFHCARLFSGQARVSDKYEDLKKTIVINILDFSLFKNDLYWNRFFLLNPETLEKLTDLVEIHFLEIPKARKKEVKNPLEFWLKFIDNPKAQELKNSYLWDEVFKEATECYDKALADPKTKELIRIREKAEMDYNSAIFRATEEGEKKGLKKAEKQIKKAEEEKAKAEQALAQEKAKAEQALATEKAKAEQALAQEKAKATQEKLEIAKNMLKARLSIEQVSQISGLSVEQVKDLV